MRVWARAPGAETDGRARAARGAQVTREPGPGRRASQSESERTATATPFTFASTGPDRVDGKVRSPRLTSPAVGPRARDPGVGRGPLHSCRGSAGGAPEEERLGRPGCGPQTGPVPVPKTAPPPLPDSSPWEPKAPKLGGPVRPSGPSGVCSHGSPIVGPQLDLGTVQPGGLVRKGKTSRGWRDPQPFLVFTLPHAFYDLSYGLDSSIR